MNRIVKTICLVLFLIGAALFIVDLLNPLIDTPPPITYRARLLAARFLSTETMVESAGIYAVS